MIEEHYLFFPQFIFDIVEVYQHLTLTIKRAFCIKLIKIMAP